MGASDLETTSGLNQYMNESINSCSHHATASTVQCSAPGVANEIDATGHRMAFAREWAEARHAPALPTTHLPLPHWMLSSHRL